MSHATESLEKSLDNLYATKMPDFDKIFETRAILADYYEEDGNTDEAEMQRFFVENELSPISLTPEGYRWVWWKQVEEIQGNRLPWEVPVKMWKSDKAEIICPTRKNAERELWKGLSRS